MGKEAAAQVARKLSKVQREQILRGSIGDASMATVRALINKGLMYIRIDSPNGQWGFCENTDLGNSVAQALRENPNG